MTLLVDSREDLERWDRHLTSVGVEHSAILAGLQAWMLVVPDPDGTRLRLYTAERHGPEVTADVGNHWLDESVRLS